MAFSAADRLSRTERDASRGADTYLAWRRFSDRHWLMRTSRSRSVWWQMWSGMRAYGVSITVVWAMCACSVLAVLAVAVPGTWAHIGFAGGAVLELLLSAASRRFLSRASVRGRFDV